MNKMMQRREVRVVMRVLSVAIVALWFWLSSWLVTPAALALTQLRLFDMDYHECPPEIAKGAVTSGGVSMAANCFLVTGKAENKSGKTVFDADIYGRIYDANEDPILQNRTRLGAIESVPPGISDFEFRISVPTNQPLPLQLKQFKAAGFSGAVRSVHDW